MEEMNLLGYYLDFSLKSLIEEIDKILDTEIGVEPKRSNEWDEEISRKEANLEAYFGETLCRLFDGRWAGDFYTNNGGNFYTSFIKFGEYKFFPSHFIQYRVSNGKESEGRFQDYFEKVKSKITARKAE